MSFLDAIRKATGRGCVTCGADNLVSIGLREIDASKPFHGDLRSCAGCDQLFWESGVVLQDHETFQSLTSAFKPGVRTAISHAAVLISEPSPPRSELYRCVLGPEFHSPKGVDFVRSVLWHPLLTENTARFRRLTERISIEIDGYSDDPRDLWAIPEVSRFFWMLHDEIIGIELWMTKESVGRFLHAAAAGIPDERREQILAMQHALRDTVEDAGHAVDRPEDHDLILQFLALEALQKAESFLAGAFNDDAGAAKAVLEQSALHRLLH